jgi:flagellar P-ring protein precursor FlgI
MMRYLIALILALCGCAASAAPSTDTAAVRLKDLGKFAGWRDNALTGLGLVTGLAGTGDTGNNKATRQAIANLLAQFDMPMPPDQVLSRNAAVVMITATLPPAAAPGTAIDINVTSMGDARSLAGGTLLVAPLKAVNGKVYALAQGQILVGGYKYDMNGNVVQKNHPTVGTVPGGATVEVGVNADVMSGGGNLTFTLSSADYTTSSRVAAAVNQAFGKRLATARDAEKIDIAVPESDRPLLVDFIGRIEKLQVEPDRRARVVINERTGTVVSGGDVRIAKVAISHGDLKISIVTDNTVSQPIMVRQTGPAVRTETVANSRIEVDEQRETGYVSASGNSVADLIQALTRIKTSTRDIISILSAMKAAGALHAELVIQ